MHGQCSPAMPCHCCAEFHVTEATGGPVVDERKLGAIRQVCVW